MKILIMGLPGSGKSTLAEKLAELVSSNTPADWINADQVREQYNDWDFSYEGRLRQAERMRDLAELAEANGVIAICDFICPTEELRQVFGADMTIWMDTIKESKYADTNKLFEFPLNYDFKITEHNDRWPETLADLIWILE
jgi:adenylylsulfate kinase